MAARMKDAGTVPPQKNARGNDSRRRPKDTFERDLVTLQPYLLNFARRLCGRQDFAEDIAQETLIKAWRARERFEPGTNLKAWLFTILRNELYSYQRRAWRQTAWDEDFGERIPAPADEQLWAMELSDCARALGQLPAGQRETLLLVGAGGFTYENAAGLLSAPVGTLKSRLARGRSGLTKLMAGSRSLQPRSQTRATDGADDILAQVAAVETAGRSTTPPHSRSR